MLKCSLFFHSGHFSGRFRSILSDNLEKYLLMLHVSDSIISTYLKSTTYLIISPLNGQRWVIKMDRLYVCVLNIIACCVTGGRVLILR